MGGVEFPVEAESTGSRERARAGRSEVEKQGRSAFALSDQKERKGKSREYAQKIGAEVFGRESCHRPPARVGDLVLDHVGRSITAACYTKENRKRKERRQGEVEEVSAEPSRYSAALHAPLPGQLKSAKQDSQTATSVLL